MALFVAAIHSGCTMLSGGKAKSVEPTIRGLDAQFGISVAQHDLEGYLAAYAPTAVAVAGDFPLSGIDAIRMNAKRFLSAPGLVYSVVPEKMEFAPDGELVLDHGRVTVVIDTLQGQSKLGAPYLHVWRKTRGEWKLIFEYFRTLEKEESGRPHKAGAEDGEKK